MPALMISAKCSPVREGEVFKLLRFMLRTCVHVWSSYAAELAAVVGF